MGKKKIKIEQLKNQRTRQLTFTKRKKGLIKKAMELSILCNANIYLRISSPEISNDISIFSTTDPKSMIKIINSDNINSNISNNNYSKINLYNKEQYHNMFTRGRKYYSVSTSSNSVTPSVGEDELKEQKNHEYDEQTINESYIHQNEFKSKDEVVPSFNVIVNNNDILFNNNMVDCFSDTFTEISE